MPVRTRFRRTVTANMIMFVILLATAVTAPLAAAEPENVITIEGEAATGTDFPMITSNAAASGGAYLKVFTADEPADGTYSAAYTVHAAAGGLYTFDADMTPLAGASWASPVSIKINGTAYIPTPQQYGQVISEIRKYHLGTVWLAAGDNKIEFSVDGHRDDDPRYLTFIDRLQFAATELQVATVESDAPLDVFQASQEIRLDLLLNGTPAEPSAVGYRVLDYWGAEVGTGSVPVPDGERKVSLRPGDLPIGHYRVEAAVDSGPALVHEFAVVVDKASRPALTDSPFGIDAIGTWAIPADRQAEAAAGLGLSGITWMRGRTSWDDKKNPSAGVFDFSGEAGMKALYQAVEAEGINVLAAYHRSPGWTKGDPTDIMPSDLMAAYRYALAAGTHYDEIDAWEIWNEVDAPGSNPFGSGNESADQYAAMMKAAAIGFLDSPNKPLISDAGTAGRVKPFTELMARNDVFSFADIHAYHLYATDDGSEVPNAWGGIPDHVDFVDRHGSETTGRWITEAGVKFQVPTTDNLTAQQQRAQARGFVVATLTALSQGSDKRFTFSLPPLNEGNTFFGLLTRDYAPNAAFTAEAAMTHALGKAAYIGPVPGVPAGVTAFAFNDGDDQVIALWSEEPKAVQLELGAPSVQRTTIVGATDELTSATGRYDLTAGPDPVYLRVHNDRVVEGESSLRPVESTTSGVKIIPAQRVVVAQRFSAEARANAKAQGYTLSGDEPNKITVELYNLNDEPMTGTLRATTGNGWKVTAPTGQVTIPAKSKASVGVVLTAGPDTVMGTKTDLRISTTFDGVEGSPSVSEITGASSTMAAAHVLTEDDDHALRLKYTNTTDRPVRPASVTVRYGSEPATVPTRGAVVEPGASTSFDVPFPADAEDGLAYLADVTLAGGAQPPSIAGTLRVPKADAIADVVPVDRLADVPPTATIGRGVDLAADLKLGWSADALVVDATVTDDTHRQIYTGQNTWQGDGLQVAIAPGVPGETVSPGGEFGIALTGAGPEAVVFRDMDGSPGGTTKAKAVATRDDAAGTTRYRLEIPWSELGPIALDQRLLSLSVLVNDDDGGGRSFIGWGDGISNIKDSSLYKAVAIVD